MPPYKRKLMSSIAFSASQKKRKGSQAMVGLRPTQKSKLLSVLKGHTQYTPTVARLAVALIGGSASVHCLHSTTASATAAAGTGQLGNIADSAMLNFLEVRGHIAVRAVDAKVAATSYPGMVRLLIVRFKKAELQPDASGTLPPITEVLESDDWDAMPIASDVQNGRFTILSDRNFSPSNWVAVQSTNEPNVPCASVAVNYRVKVNRQCDFVSTGVGGATTNGHYDSDTAFGQVNKGLLCMYAISNHSGGGFAPYGSISTRLQYTE